MPPSLLDRFRGCLLGLAVGDAVGSPFEGVDGYGIYTTFGRAIDLVRSPPVDGDLQYTDDTEMAVGVAEALVETGRADPDALAAAFARNYDPRRGYGHSVKKILQAMKDGGDWRHLAATDLPGGSWGNGGAMRVAPVGLFFHRDLDQVDREAAASAAVTHRHPVGIDGARLLALAVAMAAQPDAFGRVAFFSELYGRARTDEFREKVERAATAGPDLAPSALGTSVAAHESVVTAILCFDQYHDAYDEVLAAALRAGGDVDTIAAMAGALSGARLGVAAIPPHLLARLENDVRGRDEIDVLATRLYERHVADAK